MFVSLLPSSVFIAIGVCLRVHVLFVCVCFCALMCMHVLWLVCVYVLQYDHNEPLQMRADWKSAVEQEHDKLLNDHRSVWESVAVLMRVRCIRVCVCVCVDLS